MKTIFRHAGLTLCVAALTAAVACAPASAEELFSVRVTDGPLACTKLRLLINIVPTAISPNGGATARARTGGAAAG